MNYEKIVQQRAFRDACNDLARQLTPQDREAIAETLIKAMNAGDLSPRLLSRFDVDPIGTLAMIPPLVAEKYGFPQFDVLEKSSSAAPGGFLGTGVDRDELSERLLKAVREGALVPQVLSAFDANPDKVLRALSDDVCQAFSIPRPGTCRGAEPLRKSLRDVNMDEFEREIKQAGLWRS